MLCFCDDSNKLLFKVNIFDEDSGKTTFVESFWGVWEEKIEGFDWEAMKFERLIGFGIEDASIWKGLFEVSSVLGFIVEEFCFEESWITISCDTAELEG